MAIDSCIDEGILEDILRKERAKVTSSLITALTDEEIERLHQYQLDTARSEGIEQGIEQGRILKSFEAVDALVAEGIIGAEKACEILGVDIKEYENHVQSNHLELPQY